MTDLLITYERPESLTESEFRSWFIARVKALTDIPAALILEPGTRDGLSAMRLTLHGDQEQPSVQDVISELLGDMRMLGQRPTVIAAENGESKDAPGRQTGITH